MPTHLTPLVLFCRIWAVAECFHLTSSGRWFEHPFGLIRLATLVFFLATPFSLRRFCLMLSADVLYLAAISPFTPNHILFTLCVDLTLLAVLAPHLRGAPERVPHGEVYAQIQSLLRIETLLLYGFAVFHKLNRDFFDPAVSCATDLLVRMQRRYPALPIGPEMRLFTVHGTLVVEAAIPVLLCFRSVRRFGILLGLGFHWILAAHQHHGLYSFSALMYAMLFTFVPASTVAAVLDRLAREARLARVRSFFSAPLSSVRPRWPLVGGALLPALGLAFACQKVASSGDVMEALYDCVQVVWLALAGGLISLYLATAFRRRSPERGAASSMRRVRAPALALAMPVVIAVHSFLPYLGLATVPCLSMFSNLRTEGTLSNHWIVPPGLKVFGFQDDLVQVLASNDKGLHKLAEKGLVIPYFELCRVVNGIEEPLTLRFERSGRTFVFANALPGQRPGIQPTPWLLGKLLRFRPVDREGPMTCRW